MDRIPLQFLILCLSAALGAQFGCAPYESPPSNEIFDTPMSGLSPAQMDIHLQGDEAFGQVFTAQTGLGPVYNASSCDTCHPGEAKGHPNFNLSRFGKSTDEAFLPLANRGGPQLQDRSIPGYPAESVPEAATGVAELTPPAITGLGLVEAVDDRTFFEMADPKDDNDDGISGRVQLIDSSDMLESIVDASRLAGETDPDRFNLHNGKYIGRFGWKARAISLRHQTIFAYSEDMGITTPFNPDDIENAEAVGPSGHDGTPDPEVSTSTVSQVVFYLKTLRPPKRRKPQSDAVRAGEKIFGQIGCADCHHPDMETGDSKIPQLSNRTFHPYSDFLLHDMGPDLNDGYTEGRAKTSEWRTAPLWGLGLADDFQGQKPHLLHDGRANSIREAIELHGGEAASSSKAFQALESREKHKLLKFLKSL